MAQVDLKVGVFVVSLLKKGSSENDRRSNVYDRLEFKIVFNCCYPNYCCTAVILCSYVISRQFRHIGTSHMTFLWDIHVRKTLCICVPLYLCTCVILYFCI